MGEEEGLDRSGRGAAYTDVPRYGDKEGMRES